MGVSCVHHFVVDVVQSATSNIISINDHIRIPIPSVLFVPHPQSVAHFMNCCSNLIKYEIFHKTKLMYTYFYIKGETHRDIVLISLLFILVELSSVVLGQNSDYPKVKTYYKKKNNTYCDTSGVC